MDYPRTPTLDQMIALEGAGESPLIQRFLDWLLDEQGYELSTQDRDGDLRHVLYDREKLMAQFFQIDLEAAERERQAVLDFVRSQDG